MCALCDSDSDGEDDSDVPELESASFTPEPSFHTGDDAQSSLSELSAEEGSVSLELSFQGGSLYTPTDERARTLECTSCGEPAPIEAKCETCEVVFCRECQEHCRCACWHPYPLPQSPARWHWPLETRVYPMVCNCYCAEVTYECAHPRMVYECAMCHTMVCSDCFVFGFGDRGLCHLCDDGTNTDDSQVLETIREQNRYLDHVVPIGGVPEEIPDTIRCHECARPIRDAPRHSCPHCGVRHFCEECWSRGALCWCRFETMHREGDETEVAQPVDHGPGMLQSMAMYGGCGRLPSQ